jgi:hypothetical protein
MRKTTKIQKTPFLISVPVNMYFFAVVLSLYHRLGAGGDLTNCEEAA